MIVAIQGSRNFNDYMVFMRGIGTALRKANENEDKEVTEGVEHIDEYYNSDDESESEIIKKENEEIFVITYK